MLRDLSKACPRCREPAGEDCFRPEICVDGKITTMPCGTPMEETMRLFMEAVHAKGDAP